jgi:uncharacterized protein
MFWDSSAVVPLLLAERRSFQLASLFGSDAEAAIWWGSPVECLSAIHRRHRESPLREAVLAAALDRLNTLAKGVDTVAPTSDVRDHAGRFPAAYPLRAGDALQLAAGLAWCGGRPQGETFVCLDDRLRGGSARRLSYCPLRVRRPKSLPPRWVA